MAWPADARSSTGRESDRVPTVDLRPPGEEGDHGLTPDQRRFYRTGFLGALFVVAVGIALEVPLSVLAMHSPVERVNWYWAEPDWSVTALRDSAGTSLRTGDRFDAINGFSAAELQRSVAARTTLDEALRAGETLHVAATRSAATPVIRSVTSVGGFTARGSRPAETVTDTVATEDAGLPLSRALTRFADSLPSGVDATGAQAALEAHRPGLALLPAGTIVRLQMEPTADRSTQLLVTPPDGAGVELVHLDGGWSSLPAGAMQASISGVRRPLAGSLGALGPYLLTGLTAVLGLLALRARASGPALCSFAPLCLLIGAGAVLQVTESWARWRPMTTILAVGEQSVVVENTGPDVWSASSIPDAGDGPVALFGMAGLLLAGGLAIRFLHDFPARDEGVAERYPVPKHVMGSLALAAGAIAIQSFLWRRGIGITETTTAAMLGVVLVILVGLLTLLVRVAQVAVARYRTPSDPEQVMQSRLVLLSLVAGVALMVLAAFVPSGFDEARPWTHRLDAVGSTVRTLALYLGLALPLIGFYVALLRKGLWDVDLLVRRATLYSVLTVAFFGLWIALELVVESFLEGRLASVPLGGLLPAALAAVLVAVSQRSVGDLIARRVLRSPEEFADAIQSIIDDTHAAEPQDRTRRLVDLVRERLGAEHCALLLPAEGAARWRAWRSGPAPSAAAVTASVLPGLPRHRHQVVTTEQGITLASRIGAADSPIGLLLLGSADEDFYSTDERRLISLLLSAVGPGLAANAR